MTAYYLWLLQIFGVANPKIHQLVRHYGSPKNVYQIIEIDKDWRLLTSKEKVRALKATLEKSNKMIEICGKRGINIVNVTEDNYPHRLKNIYNPPSILFYRGNIEGLDKEICLAGVGAREITNYSINVTKRICHDLARLGVVVVSGMALGTDSVVHNTVLEAGGRAVGVLACGFEVDYPRGSIPQRERICELGGACVTEQLPTAQTTRTYFHARNRIMSGLSMGVMIFQAGERSGSLITANHAIQQGRDVFCVPPADIYSPVYSGVVELLRDGATPLFSYLDVVCSYLASFHEKHVDLVGRNEVVKKEPKAEEEDSSDQDNDDEDNDIGNEAPAPINDAPAPIEKKKSAPKTVEKQQPPESKSIKYLFEEQEGHHKVIEMLSNGACTLEKLTAGLDYKPSELALYLIQLELANVIKVCPGSKYELL